MGHGAWPGALLDVSFSGAFLRELGGGVLTGEPNRHA